MRIRALRTQRAAAERRPVAHRRAGIRTAHAAAGILLTTTAVVAGPAVPAGADDPSLWSPAETSDNCTLSSIAVEELEPDWYFGDARLSCPVEATVGGRWELDGQELESYTEQLGPGEVPVFDDLELSTQPGRELCFIATAWFNDQGKSCLTT